MDNLLDNYIYYLNNHRSGSKNTSESYYRDISRFIAFLKEHEITDFAQVTKQTVYEYVEALRKGQITSCEISEATFARAMSSLRSFYRYLNEIDEVKTNPFLLVHFSKHRAKLPDVLTFDQIERLFASFDIDNPSELRDRTILETIYACGLRVSEALNLNLTDIDLDEMILKVTGKGNKERYLPFYGRLRDLLIMYLNDYWSIYALEDNDALFINLRGQRITARSVQMSLEKHSALANLPMNVHPHLLRHSFATHLLDNGADLRVVQTLLGHENLSTTQIYTHLTTERLKKVVNEAHPHKNAK